MFNGNHNIMFIHANIKYLIKLTIVLNVIIPLRYPNLTFPLDPVNVLSFSFIVTRYPYYKTYTIIAQKYYIFIFFL